MKALAQSTEGQHYVLTLAMTVISAVMGTRSDAGSSSDEQWCHCIPVRLSRSGLSL
jgi:hypothetical protein